MDHKLLDILVCPVTGAALEEMDQRRLAALNERVAAGDLRSADGRIVDTPVEAALITADGLSAYRIEDNIPILLPGSAIAVDP